MFSDHRPVFATFQCTVSVVNESAKGMLSRELYLKGKSILQRSNNSTSLLDNDSDDEGDLLDPKPLAPGCECSPLHEKVRNRVLRFL
jgi:hypothetical protein